MGGLRWRIWRGWVGSLCWIFEGDMEGGMDENTV
jgi:hypothetical protein